ncbi:hypothetical protein HII31_13221 [Pseudocercospora fuligena]|uniref:Uncharacterized protein n=1 Tax=Pseudocercospora fuligena TaxID=685502 RepID=A0A8H6R6H7_9PEZI|nr:hypothetical protein HII31_13221 [Pseudocercospora fuligena]
MLIDLRFPGPHFASLKMLERWLGRAGCKQNRYDLVLDDWVYQAKKGAFINYQYSAKADHPALYLNSVLNPGTVLEMSLSHTLNQSYPGRRKQESDKIKEALKQAHIEFEKSRLVDALDEEDLETLKTRTAEQHGRREQIWPWHLGEEDVAGAT